jgi:hypothetical protein
MNPSIRRLNLFGHTIFARYVKSLGEPVKIAIVGNGGLSQEDQEHIDGANCVIRFNNYATRDGIQYTADRFRCDVLFTTTDLHSEGADPHSVVIGVPFPFKIPQVTSKIHKWYPRARPYMVNPYLNHLMVQELELWSPAWEKLPEKVDPRGWMHPFPSVGFTCLWHLLDIIKTVPSFNPLIFVAGFNWYAENEGQKIQGWDMKRTDYPTHWNHNYPKEARWIIENLMNHDQFSFSEQSWRILETVKKNIS